MKDRIALVVNTLSNGGVEKTAANLSRLLSYRYSVDIIVNDDAHIQYPHQGRIITLHMPKDKNRMDFDYQVKALFRRTRVLKRLKKKYSYKAVLSFSEMTNLANVLSGGKTIISVHNSVSKSKINGWKHKLVTEFVLPFCFKRAYRTVSCSKEIADELIRDYGLSKEKSYVIYNGVDLQNIREQMRVVLPESFFDKDEKLIVTIGRLTWEKDQWHLIRVAGKLLEEGLFVKLIILGEGPLRASLEALITKLGLEGEVHLLGFVENPFQYMAKADVAVFSSQTEGFSNAIIEALACGVPVISTDHETGAREILSPNSDYHEKIYDRIDKAPYGLLVPVCNGSFNKDSDSVPFMKEERLMVDAIRWVITDPELSLHYRDAALERAKQLDIHTIASEWIRVIEN